MNTIKAQINEKIQQGKIREAAQLLRASESDLQLGGLERAQFFRRLGLHYEALKVLRPTLYLSGGELAPSPDPLLMVEYATNLSQVGLTREAEWMLARVSLQNYSYYQAQGFLSLRQLDFKKALGYFVSAEKTEDASAYQKLIARVNQLNSLLGCFEYQRAVQFGLKLKKDLSGSEHSLLSAYSDHWVSLAYAMTEKQEEFETHSQMAFERLALDPKKLSEKRDFFEFYRGRSFGQILLTGKSEIPVKLLLERAIENHDYYLYEDFQLIMSWEKLRKTGVERELVSKLRGCRPFFRNRFEAWLGVKVLQTSMETFTEKDFIGKIAKTKKKVSFNLDLGNGVLKPGQLPLRLLTVFFDERYPRFSAPELYQRIFPEKRSFHPVTSVNLVHQAVKRLNRLLKQSHLPMQVESVLDRYVLKVSGSFVTTRTHFFVNPFLKSWKTLFGVEWVSTKTVSVKLGLVQRMVQIKVAEHSDAFESKREGRSILYRLKA